MRFWIEVKQWIVVIAAFMVALVIVVYLAVVLGFLFAAPIFTPIPIEWAIMYYLIWALMIITVVALVRV